MTLAELSLRGLAQPSSSKLQYLMISNSVIGTLRGPDASVNDPTLATSRPKRGKFQSGVVIIDSQIGAVEPHGLSVTAAGAAVVSIENVTIGFVKTAAIQLAGKLIFSLNNSTLNLNGDASLVIDKAIKIVVKNNRIIVADSVLNSIDCEDNDVKDNTFIFLDEERHNSSMTTPSDQMPSGPVPYGCLTHNTVLTVSGAPPMATVPPTEPGPTPPTATIVYGVVSVSAAHVHIHKGLAYMAAVVTVAVIAAVMVLAGLLAYRRRGAAGITATTRERRNSLLYVPGGSVTSNLWPANSNSLVA